MRDYASLFRLLLQDLGLDCTPDSHHFTDGGVERAFRVALASSFYKKLSPNGNSTAADANALKKFLSINAALPADPYEFGATSEVESHFWDYFTDHLNTVVGPHEGIVNFDLDFIRESMMCGPGAAQKADSRSLVTKLFQSPLSYTEDHLLRLYRGALVDTGLWCDAEMLRHNRFGESKVRGGKLFFAPKNAEISRTCCTEASLNMLVQKAIGAFLEFRLEHFFGISLRTEPDHNRELARIGSVDGSFGTIDLTSASDSIGLQLCLRAFRHSSLKAIMMLSRSERAVLPDGAETELRMISTMGNGFTFPLQTVIFACAVRATYDLMGITLKDRDLRNFGVFGDDIVVRREAFTFLSKMLEKLGFSVNVGKSFNTGPFRESCGHDYYAGVNIRGVYVRSLEIPQEVYSLINRLNRWTAHSGIPLPCVISLLKSWVRDIRVPPSESDDAGLHVPFKLSRPSVDASYWFKYRCYKRRLQRMAVDEPDSDPAPSNPEGIGVGFLSGVYRRRDFVLTSTDDSAWKHDWAVSHTLRDEIGARPRYKIVTRSIPYWDFIHNPKNNGDPIEGSAGTRWGTPNQGESPDFEAWRIPLTRDSYDVWSRVVGDMLTNS